MFQLALAALLSAASLADPGDPFPTKTTTVQEPGSKFTVSGRQFIAKGAKVSIIRESKIKGEPDGSAEGPGDVAVIEVSGELTLKAAGGGVTELRDVWIELTPECRSLHLTNVWFSGSGGIRASKKGSSKADVYMQKCTFTEGTTLSLDCHAGTVNVIRCWCEDPAKLRGVPHSKRRSSTAVARVLDSLSGGYDGGLEVSGFKQALVERNSIEGHASRFADNGKLVFGGNDVRSDRVEFASSAPIQ